MNLIEELHKVSNDISSIQYHANSVEISQLTLTAEATLASMRVELRKRKRVLEAQLQGMRLSAELTNTYEPTIDSLLEYIDDPSITNLIKSL